MTSRIPRLVVITAGAGVDSALGLISRLTREGFVRSLGWVPPLSQQLAVLLREPALNTQELAWLSQEAKKQCEAQGIAVLVSRDAEAAEIGDADGLHLPEAAAGRRIAGKLLGRSCHSRSAIQRAEAEGCDYVFLSPFLPPRSHVSSLPALGPTGFAEAVKGLRIPVLALGGITAASAETAIAAGAWGVAAITGFEGND
jgi:thiamine-phosphate pyrophosphorylase